MKIRLKLVHAYNNNKLHIINKNSYMSVYFDNIVGLLYFIGTNDDIDLENKYNNIQSIEEYIEKSKKLRNSKFICVTKFSCFEIIKDHKGERETRIHFIELIK